MSTPSVFVSENITFRLVSLLPLRSQTPLRALSTVLMATVLATACAGADGESGSAIPRNFPTVASPDLHGRYEIDEATVEGRSLDVATPTQPVVDIDVVTGAVTVELTCNLAIGSFTLDPDQMASFTLPGGTSEPCPDGGVETALLATLSRIDGWRPTADGLEIFSSAGDLLVLRRI